MPRLPMEAYKSTDQQITAILRCLRQGLMKQQSVPNGAIEDAVENMCESLTLQVELVDQRIDIIQSGRNVRLDSEIS